MFVCYDMQASVFTLFSPFHFPSSARPSTKAFYGLLWSCVLCVPTSTFALCAQVSVTDHAGFTFSSARSACAMSDADTVLRRFVDVTFNQQWTVSIGQCKQFTTAFVASRYLVWVYIAAVSTTSILLSLLH